MEIRVHAQNEDIDQRIGQLLMFYLADLEGEIDLTSIFVDSVADRLGVRQYRCCVQIQSGCGWCSDVEEIQGDLELAVTRALDRSLRTLRRRLKLRRYTRCA